MREPVARRADPGGVRRPGGGRDDAPAWAPEDGQDGTRTEVPRSRPGDGSAVWHHQARRWLALGVWTERRPGRGEDADPLFVHHGPTAEGIVGVFDGVGGAGASIAFTSRDGVPRTGAWVGARRARACAESWFLDHARGRTPFVAESLRERLAADLAAARPRTRSKILGSMRRELPSTMAAVRYRLNGERVECQALWAGDSRAYALTPRGGLQALTRDHTVETDTLDQLLHDPPLTNMLCADRPFTVESHLLLLEQPCVLVCATDGFFGYVDTPAHFERHLLGTLRQARDGNDWAERLAARVSAYTADDASLCLVAFGFGGFEELSEDFGHRLRDLEARYAMNAGDAGGDHAVLARWRVRTWEDYRQRYERLMPRPPAREGDR